MDNLIPIIIEVEGYVNGALLFEEHRMKADPEERLVQIIDRIESTLEHMIVKKIKFK